MDRLTYKHPSEYVGVVATNMDMDCIYNMSDEQYKGFQEILEKLNSYETTGLSPEDVKSLVLGGNDEKIR